MTFRDSALNYYFARLVPLFDSSRSQDGLLTNRGSLMHINHRKRNPEEDFQDLRRLLPFEKGRQNRLTCLARKAATCCLLTLSLSRERFEINVAFKFEVSI